MKSDFIVLFENFETNNINRGRIDSFGGFYVYDTSLRKSNRYLQIDSITGRLIASEVSGSGGIYKVYTAIITQTGTDAPTAVVLQNTLGITPTLTRFATGNYRITASNTFTANKTFCIVGQEANSGTGMNYIWASDSNDDDANNPDNWLKRPHRFSIMNPDGQKAVLSFTIKG